MSDVQSSATSGVSNNSRIVIIGGGNSAAEESLFLTRFADRITILVREDSMSAVALVVAKQHDNM